MTTAPLVPLEDYGVGLGEAISVVRNNAIAAGLGAPVPTCPGWTVADLVRHLGVPHRWAVGVLAGESPQEAGARALKSSDGVSDADLLDWLDDGLIELLNAIARAPHDLQAFFFLKNAPTARIAWARRQCHESTIHAVDAMSARLGQAPLVAQTWISDALALDGLDELLRGFLPRRGQTLRTCEPMTVEVRLTNTSPAQRGEGEPTRGWRLVISQDPVEVSEFGVLADDARDGADAEPDVVVTGTPVALYLGLWNRGEEFIVTGRPQWLDLWRAQMRISWS